MNTKLLAIYDRWCNEAVRKPNSHHQSLRSQIAAAANPSVTETNWFESSKLSAATFNYRLGILKHCLTWAKRQGLVFRNPWLEVPNRIKVDELEPWPFIKPSLRILAGKVVFRFRFNRNRKQISLLRSLLKNQADYFWLKEPDKYFWKYAGSRFLRLIASKHYWPFSDAYVSRRKKYENQKIAKLAKERA